MDTRSYWIETAALPRFPRIAADLTVDVAVVGAGITGVTAARLLKQAGLKVALLERQRCACIDTGHTTAHLTAVTDRRLHEIRRTFGDEAARAVWDAGAAAIDQIVTLIRAEGIACDFRWVTGYLHAPLPEPDGKAIDELRAEAEAAARLGIDATFLEEVPAFGLPGVRFPHQAFFHPRKYLEPLLRAIDGDGSHVFEESPVEEVQEQPLAVKSGGHRVICGHVIFATHNPLAGLTGPVAAALFQTKLALYSSYVLGAKLPSGRLPEALFWDTSDPYHYLRVERRAGHDYAIFGGEDHKTGQVEDTAAVYDRLEQDFRSFAPEAVIDRRWSGQVIETNDGLPFIGETAEHQFVGTGFSGNGMTFGTLTAMMAVDAVLQRPNPWADLFDVHRRKLRGGTWRYLAENKDYPYFLARSWLAQGERETPEALQPGEGRILNLNGRKVAASRSADGEISLCSPVCTHLQCIVGWNNAERTWDCPCHGSRFKPTGEVISGPAEEPLPKLDATGQPLPSG